MQEAGMLRGTRAVYLLVSLLSLIGYAHPFPLQLLPSIPGYIPVYIRHGEQPLEEINPALAEAFHEGPSLPKSIRLDNIPGPTVIGVQEDEAFLEKSKKKNIYGVHVRDVEGDTPSNKDKKSNKPTETSPEVETPKLLTIYELRDDNDHRGSHREKPMKKQNPKEPVVKASPLTDEEKEAREKFTIQVAKDESGSNDVHNLDSNVSELKSKVTGNKNNIRNNSPLLKTGEIITDDTIKLPNRHPVKDIPQTSVDGKVPDPPIKDDEPPTKVQRLPNVLANVHKLSPIALPENSTDRESILRDEIVESTQDEKSKDLTERNDDVSTN